MPANTTYRRRSRPRGGRAEPRGDAIVSAITVQVVICIALLLSAVLAKNMNEERYNQVRLQYDLMVTDPGASGEVIEELSGAGSALQRAFASIESGITSLVNRFLGGGQASPPADPDVDEPPLSSGSEAERPQTADAFDFDYLSPSEIIYTTASLGADSSVFAKTAVGDNRRAAPEWATFAQVEIMGKVKPPITGPITSEFSYRVHPLSGSDDFHNGMDIAAEAGRDILAALPGEVSEVGEDDIYGKYIKIKHAMHLETFYAHCSEIIASPGDAVRQGERIAKVGSTGMATGPHLHFSVIVGGQYADPYWVLKDSIELVG